MKNKEIADEVKRLVDKYMVWTDDKVAFDKDEHWTSWAKEILDLERTGTRKTIRDDCDGFALTSAALLHYKGVPRKDIALGYCQTEDGGYHLVCLCREGETTWLLDNRFNTVIPKHRAYGYTWRSEMVYDAIGNWAAAKP